MSLDKVNKIFFKDLHFAYEGGDLLFENLDFEVPTHEVVWVTGESGSGKSAFLRLLVSLVQPQSGQILVDEKDLTKMSFEDLIPYRQAFGYSFDFGGLLNNKTLEQNLLLPLEYHNLWTEEERRQWVQKLLKTFGVEKLAHSRPSTVPGGVRKAMSVARAFVMKPSVVVLDDPTTGLRSSTKTALKDLIHEQHEKGFLKHIFICSEDQHFLKDLTTTTISVENKKIINKEVEPRTHWRKAGGQ